MSAIARYKEMLTLARQYADAPPCGCATCVEEGRDRHAEQPSDSDWTRLSEELAEYLDDEELTGAGRNEYARLSREAYLNAGRVMNGEAIS